MTLEGLMIFVGKTVEWELAYEEFQTWQAIRVTRRYFIYQVGGALPRIG